MANGYFTWPCLTKLAENNVRGAHTNGHVISSQLMGKVIALRVISCLDANWSLNRSPLFRGIPLAQQIRHAPAYEDLR